MHVLGPALAGALAIIAPIIAHANGPGSNMRPANAGASANIVLVWDGGGSSVHSGRLGAAPQPAAPSNGTGGRALLTGDQTVSTAGGAPMVGRQCRLTGSGFPGSAVFDYPFADWRGPTGGWGNP
jgi:hypothetical protein